MTRRSLLLTLFAAAVGATLALSAGAAGGDLDPTFDGDGRAIVDFGGPDDAFALAVQPDGKVVVAGGNVQPDPTGGAPSQFAVARLSADGTPDATFGGDGRALGDVGTSGTAFAVALQPDGKIVAAGVSLYFGRPVFTLLRFLADGGLDPAFGDGGRVKTDLGEASGVYALAVQPDGKIVAAGYRRELSVFNQTLNVPGTFALARYNGDGSLDATFGDGGVTTTSFGADTQARAQDVAVAADGTIVAAGWRKPTALGPQANAVALARYTPDGRLDPSLDGDGVLVHDFDPAGVDQAFALAIQKDGKLVVSGNGGAGGLLVARFARDGSLDSAFGEGGVATGHDVGGAGALAIDARDRIVAGGGTGGSDFAIARFTPAGRLDRGFGGDGEVVTDMGAAEGVAAVAVDAVGRVVAAGTTTRTDVDRDFAVARYLPSTCLVPSLKRKTVRAARAALDGKGCSLGRVRKAWSSKVKKGRVVSQRPAAGSELAEGSAVAIVVSRGKRR